MRKQTGMHPTAGPKNRPGARAVQLLTAALLAVLISGCGAGGSAPPAPASSGLTTPAAVEPSETAAAAATGSAAQTEADRGEGTADGETASGYAESREPSNFVDIQMDSGRHIVLELLPDAAPATVANFQKLVGAGFYDGLIFHRVIDGFMIQGGDPAGTGLGGAPDRIPGEFASNGFDNSLSHRRGVVSMARSADPDSASSQFFICQADSTFLDGDYAAFGRVLSGMDEVDRIAGLKTDAADRPAEVPVMQTVRMVEPVEPSGGRSAPDGQNQ